MNLLPPIRRILESRFPSFTRPKQSNPINTWPTTNIENFRKDFLSLCLYMFHGVHIFCIQEQKCGLTRRLVTYLLQVKYFPSHPCKLEVCVLFCSHFLLYVHVCIPHYTVFRPHFITIIHISNFFTIHHGFLLARLRFHWDFQLPNTSKISCTNVTNKLLKILKKCMADQIVIKNVCHRHRHHN